MCGIAGILNFPGEHADLVAALTGMRAALQHRGPDDAGIFASPPDPDPSSDLCPPTSASDSSPSSVVRGPSAAGPSSVVRGPSCGLVHTRLSIIDLSPAGRQPMHSADGRYTIVFNGEIYNYCELRERLIASGETFISKTDTEVILKLYAREGSSCVNALAGMFAFAIWDRDEQTCFLARDPLGIKPLYYCQKGAAFAFASEMRALMRSGLAAPRVSRFAIEGYLLYGSVPEPDTLIEGVRRLRAGHHLLWRAGRVEVTQYWDVAFAAHPDATDAAWRIRDALLDSVRRHFVADVPVGIFLSGGVDSTALVALAQQAECPDLRTFCISFDDERYNEGDLARQTARYFGTSHYDWRLDAATGRRLVQAFLDASDHPSIDGFNTFCVSKHAHDNGAKVVLSGLGGDELFGGYPSFRRVPQLVRAGQRLHSLPGLPRAAARAARALGNSPRYRRLARFLSEPPTSSRAYWCVRGIFTPEEARRIADRYAAPGGLPYSPDAATTPDQPTVEDQVSWFELTRYMRNQLLRDSDVMSMAWGLELRVPFVDRRVVETIANIPAAVRLAAGKKLLLDAVPEIPEWIARRPKRGFVFPFEQWVTQEWQDVFHRIDTESPVALRTWYRRWSIFALENFLQKIGVR